MKSVGAQYPVVCHHLAAIAICSQPDVEFVHIRDIVSHCKSSLEVICVRDCHPGTFGKRSNLDVGSDFKIVEHLLQREKVSIFDSDACEGFFENHCRPRRIRGVDV
jgi:hypothetical protein